MKTAEYYIENLHLTKHPEGGYFKEVYRSAETINFEFLNNGMRGDRNFSTSIYYLLTGNDVSHFHRIKSDEIWHHYDGSTVRIYVIDQSGSIKEFIVGKNVADSESLQLAIPKGCWFCAELVDKNSFALVGCTVSPGFDFNDFELGKRKVLLNEFPEYWELIKRFTKE